MAQIISKCKNCGKFIGMTRDGYCRDCHDKVEEEFKRVRAYLKENPDATIPETSEKTGVSEKRILRFIRDDRLETVHHSQFTVQCEMCGARISSGRYCAKCSTSLLQALEKARPKQPALATRKERGREDAKRSRIYLDRDIHDKH